MCVCEREREREREQSAEKTGLKREVKRYPVT